MLANYADADGDLLSVMGGGWKCVDSRGEFPARRTVFVCGIGAREPKETGAPSTLEVRSHGPQGHGRVVAKLKFDTLSQVLAEGVPVRTPFVVPITFEEPQALRVARIEFAHREHDRIHTIKVL